MFGEDYEDDFDLEERSGLGGTLGLIGFALVAVAGCLGFKFTDHFSGKAALFILVVYGGLWIWLGTQRFAYFLIPMVESSRHEISTQYTYDPSLDDWNASMLARRIPGIVVGALCCLAVYFLAHH